MELLAWFRTECKEAERDVGSFSWGWMGGKGSDEFSGLQQIIYGFEYN